MKKSSIIIITSASVLLALFCVMMVWLQPDNKKHAEKVKESKSVGSDMQTTAGNINQHHTQKPQERSNLNPKVTEGNQKFTTGLEDLPRSLQGTKVDGEIIIDENQQLVVTYGLRRLFDYFLSAMGEEMAEVIDARVESYIRSRTPEPAASQAVSIYQSYVAYLKAIGQLEDDFGHLQLQSTSQGVFDASLLKQRQTAVKKLRQQYFNQETIDAFFTQDDSLQDYSLAMLEVENNQALTAEQKQQAKQDYIRKMPDSIDKQAIQTYQQKQANIGTLMQRTQQMKHQGASAEEIHAMRVELVGEKAAQRLQKVDAEEHEFEQRFVQYVKDREAILVKFGKNSSESRQKVSELEQSLFNESEIRRLAGYEAVRKLQLSK